jgi:hypothetical protein
MLLPSDVAGILIVSRYLIVAWPSALNVDISTPLGCAPVVCLTQSLQQYKDSFSRSSKNVATYRQLDDCIPSGWNLSHNNMIVRPTHRKRSTNDSAA